MKCSVSLSVIEHEVKEKKKEEKASLRLVTGTERC
jgi:hypothetical protein